DGKDLELNRNPAQNTLEAMTTVYNTTRTAQIQIQSAEDTANVYMERAEYIVYVDDGKGNQIQKTVTVGGEEIPVTQSGDHWEKHHLLTVDVKSLNDGLNYFYVTVTPTTGSYPKRDYVVIINYFNLDVYLDKLQVYDVKGVDDPETEGPFIQFMGKHFNSFVRGDYRFDYEPDANGKGALRVYADATTSHTMLVEQMGGMYDTYYRLQVYNKYYDMIRAALHEDFSSKDETWLDTQTKLILAGEQDDPGFDPMIANKNRNLYNETEYPAIIELEKKALYDVAMADEKVMVHIGEPDTTGTDPYVATEQISTRIMDITTDEHTDYLNIPVYLTVPSTGHQVKYNMIYHVLSDDSTLKPIDPEHPEWGVKMGVQGYEPNRKYPATSDADYVWTYEYEVPHSVNMATLYAFINHDHDGTGARVALYKLNADGSETQLRGNDLNLTKEVELETGTNDFIVRVTSEKGTTSDYLITIERREIDLSLEWVQVDGSNAIRKADGTYLAYVAAGSTPEVRAQAVERAYAKTFMINEVAPSEKSYTVGNESAVKAGEPAVMKTTTLVSDPNDPSRVQIKVAAAISTTSNVTLPTPPTSDTVETWKNHDATVTADGLDYNTGIVTHTTTHYELMAGETSVYVRTVTVEQYRVYWLTILQVDPDMVRMSVDTHEGTFLPTTLDKYNARSAEWTLGEVWADDIGVDAFVVGVPADTDHVRVRVTTMKSNVNNLQMVKIGSTEWRNSDHSNKFDAAGNEIGTNNFSMQPYPNEMAFDFELAPGKNYMEIPVRVKDSRYNTEDPGRLFMLHIYRYRCDAYLVNLQGEHVDPNAADPSTAPKVEAVLSPEFEALPIHPKYSITVENVVKVIDFTDILPCDGATATVTLPDGTAGELDPKADLILASGGKITLEKETIKSIVTDSGTGITTVTTVDGTEYELAPGTEVVYRNELRGVELEVGRNDLRIRVTSEDGMKTQDYKVTIRRKPDTNAAKLMDIQIIHPYNGEDRYYDFSPVFDPDLTTYFFAAPDLMQGDITVKPITYDPESDYVVSYKAFRNGVAVNEDAIDISGGGTVTVPELSPGETFDIELDVSYVNENRGGNTVYYMHFSRNSANERKVTNVFTMEERMKFSPFDDMKLDGQELVRSASDHSSDRNYYANVIDQEGSLSMFVLPYVLNKGYQAYITDVATYSKYDHDCTWVPLNGSQFSNYELSYSGNDNWYVIKLVDTETGHDTFYASLAVYRDLAGETDTHLKNLAVSDPTVPLFREDTYDYFVAVEEGTTLADLIARGQDNGSYITHLRVRTVGGEYLMEADELAKAEDIILHPGENRVTITVKTIRKSGNQEVTQKRAYEVELYVAYPTNSYEVTYGPTTGYGKDTYGSHSERYSDTGDIIWMEYTSGGHMAPVWNSELVNYFLSYPLYSDRLVLDEKGLPVKTLGDDGKPLVDDNGRYVYEYELSDTILFRPTLRPEEETRATVTLEWVSIDPITGDRTKSAKYPLSLTVNIPGVGNIARDNLVSETKNGDGTTTVVYKLGNTSNTVTLAKDEAVTYNHTWDYLVSGLPEGLTDFLFTVEVKADNGKITKKEYRISVWRDTTDQMASVPALADSTTIKVTDAHEVDKEYIVNPTFEKETNFYYVNVPNEVTEVNISAITATYLDKKGLSQHHNVYVNGRSVGSGQEYLVQDLMLGDNTVEVMLTGPDGVRRYYTVVINRGDAEATEVPSQPTPVITGLRVNQTLEGKEENDQVLLPAFDDSIYYYNVIVPFEVDELYFWAQAEHAAELRIASINVDDVTDRDDKLGATLDGWRKLAVPLTVGNENNIEIMAYGMDADGNRTETRVRTIVNVVRLAEDYLPPELEYLGVSEGTLTSVFDGGIYNYHVTVPYDVDEVDVDILATVKEVDGKKEAETKAKLVGGKLVSVMTDVDGKAKDTFVLKVGENVARVYLYDTRPIPDGGYPYYIGVYTVVIHRMSKNGIITEIADGEKIVIENEDETGGEGEAEDENGGEPEAQAAVETKVELKALTATQLSAADAGGNRTETALSFTTGVAFNIYNYYLYVSGDEDAAESVFFTANAAHSDCEIKINGHAKDAGKDGWTVKLAKKGDTQALVTVTDPKTGTRKNYTVTIIRGLNQSATPADRPADYYVYDIMQSVTLTGDTSVTTGTASVSGTALGHQSVITAFSPKPGVGGESDTYTVSVRTRVSDPVILSYRAEEREKALNVLDTTVRVNGHLATKGAVETQGMFKYATYTVELPMTTYEERLDIRVDYVVGTSADPYTGEEARYTVQNVSYVLNVMHSDAPRAPEVDEDQFDVNGNLTHKGTGQPIRYKSDDQEVIDGTAKVGEIKYTDKPLTGPQLGNIVLDESNTNGDSGTFTTMFRGDVFYYRATASGDKFSVFASVLPESATTYAMAPGASLYTVAELTSANTYIEVYDEAGNRYTVTNRSANYLTFEFPRDAEGNLTTTTLRFRAIHYAESGYELVNEYYLTVYP
ncbi:MAG: cadherin-like beta sandwich domain-containing protein, partial [Muribaculaceae bacterium]|nr:cadherin-like beta sandwich domain-containing protein [Muribaculaceae bacterium]